MKSIWKAISYSRFLTSTGEYPGTNRLEISGTMGKLVLEEGKLRWWRLRQPEPEARFHSEISSPHLPFDYSEERPEPGPDGHQVVLQNFSDAIRQGTALIAPGADGLMELSLSNAAYLSQWQNHAEIPLPFDEGHVTYVWFDALLNYATAVGYGNSAMADEYARRWPAQFHVVGKDIIRFHCVIWPAMLLAAGYEPAHTVFGHGFLLTKGEKMSKSKGNALSPADMVRVFGVDDRFAMVVTPEGKTGYAELGQIQFVDQETFDAYLHQSCETSDARFDREALPELGMEYIDEPYENPAEFVYALLSRAGLHFNDVYYRYYQKPLDRTDLYPHSLYRDAVYNTLMFKLFNSSGQHVTSNGNETEWAYIHNYEDLEPGDLVFFCDTTGKGDAVVKHVEVVIHGDYSGDVTDCGVYLGEDRMLTVRKGKVCELAIDPVMQYEFDSARRIYPSIVDEKAHFIENMIAAIYDRLGTPYSNAKRVGDASYDCSGIINWVLRGYDYNESKNPSIVPIEITAASFGHLEVLYSPKNELHFVDTGVHERDEESLSKLERGDLVLLLNESRTRIGHIMCYLGDMTVIHSTRIEGNYRGTLVAKFRNHLQGLYASSIRIDSFVPVQ